ncbi:hypothetical protein KI387_013477 [Taxus chinensis]|uniref:DNA excision repair protein ERCC-1 n=1 Tax=Taxus chinensis TaxID=29808 RepID=A0AA38CS78_TAXCH|nr:hypothetical protein KI387_013477 [Taxus chinensis]
MLFRTKYSTKATIRSEPIANNHIEPYLPSAINANCIIIDEEDQLVDKEPNTLLEGIPNLLLDEWGTESHEFDPYKHIEEVGLGTYCLHEEDSFIPNLVKTNEQDDGVWKMYFDGSRNRNGAGGVHEGKLLGHIVSKRGLKIDPERVSAILMVYLPNHKKALQSFLGRIDFVRRFIPDFANLVKPLTSMVKKNMVFRWTKEGNNNFKAIKNAMSQAPTLINLDLTKDFTVYAFGGIDTILTLLVQQNNEGMEHPITFFGQGLKGYEVRYFFVEKQVLFVIRSLKKFRHLICNNKVHFMVSHPSVKEFLLSKDLNEKRACWITKVMEYDVDIKVTKLSRGRGLCEQLASNLHDDKNIVLVLQDGQQSVATSLPIGWTNDVAHFLQMGECPQGLDKAKRRNIALCSVSQGRNGIIVSHRQQGNPILKHIRNVRWTFADIVPDYLLGQNTCALYISLRYHLLHPEYIYYRIRELQKSFKLRVVLCHVDVEDVTKPLHEVTRTVLLHDCTLLCGWSVEECARYLETIKTYENKPADLIQERTDNDYLSKLSIALTTVRRVNKNDVVTLGSAFGTLSGIMGASMEDLARCPGIGEHKVKRLYDTFHEPFRRVTKYSGSPMRTEVASQDKAENGEDQTKESKESGRDKVDEVVEAKHPKISVRSALSLAYAKYGKKIGEQGDNINRIDEPIDKGATSEMCLDGDVNKKRID